jgi:hypothetical protein
MGWVIALLSQPVLRGVQSAMLCRAKNSGSRPCRRGFLRNALRRFRRIQLCADDRVGSGRHSSCSQSLRLIELEQRAAETPGPSSALIVSAPQLCRNPAACVVGLECDFGLRRPCDLRIALHAGVLLTINLAVVRLLGSVTGE